jgi:hypothetical protein
MTSIPLCEYFEYLCQIDDFDMFTITFEEAKKIGRKDSDIYNMTIPSILRFESYVISNYCLSIREEVDKNLENHMTSKSSNEMIKYITERRGYDLDYSRMYWRDITPKCLPCIDINSVSKISNDRAGSIARYGSDIDVKLVYCHGTIDKTNNNHGEGIGWLVNRASQLKITTPTNDVEKMMWKKVNEKVSIEDLIKSFS